MLGCSGRGGRGGTQDDTRNLRYRCAWCFSERRQPQNTFSEDERGGSLIAQLGQDTTNKRGGTF